VGLEGSLKDFGLADILQLIFFQRKTGVLNINARFDKVKLTFIDGNVVGAESKKRIEANRLGKVLVKKGLLREDELRSLLEEQKNSQFKLGHILIKKGLVKQEDIIDIISNQIKETVIQVFGWKDGYYEFLPQAIPVDKDIPISIDTQHLLMEGLRIVDEWTLIEGKITLDSVFEKTYMSVPELTNDEEEILSLIDGENDVSTIIDISGKDDFTVSKTMLSLLEKGAIRLKEALPLVSSVTEISDRKTFYNYNPLILIIFLSAFFISIIMFFITSSNVLREYKASKTIEYLRIHVEAFKAVHGDYPELSDVAFNKSDPWGNPYILQRNKDSYLILSRGPDGIIGTSDDIF